MKFFILITLVVAAVVGKPSGVLHSYGPPLAYSSQIIAANPEVIHHHDSFVHHPIHETIVAEAPVVHHKTIVGGAPTYLDQHVSVVHHQGGIVADAPALVHKSVSVPAFNSYVAEGPISYVHEAPATIISHAPAVVQHKAVVAQAPALIQKTVVAEAPVAVSHQHSSVVHNTGYKQFVEHIPAVSHSVAVSDAVAPIVQHRALVAHSPAVVQKTIVSEPVGVKHTVSHQDSSVVHSAALRHEVPVFQQAVVAHAPIVEHVPITSQYHAQDALGQYSFGYSSPLSSKAEVKTIDGVTKGGYNYLDGTGKEQSVSYVSDAAHGFRVAASNLPVAPLPVVDTPEVAAAKAAHLAAFESNRAAVEAENAARAATVESSKVAAKTAHLAAVEHNKAALAAASARNIAHQEVSAISSAAVLPSAYSYSYVAQEPIIKSAYIQEAPSVYFDSVAIDAKLAPQPLVHKVSGHVIPGITLTAGGVPYETAEVVHAKAAHLATLRGLQVKDEKPCD